MENSPPAYKDISYFRQYAEDILKNYPLKYQKLSSGPFKGEYFVYLPMENNDLSKKYLSGEPCKYPVNGTAGTKEKAFAQMAITFADCLYERYKRTETIYASQLKNHWENKGTIDYIPRTWFKLLNGNIHKDNWQIHSKNSPAETFDEYKTEMKIRAREYFNEHNIINDLSDAATPSLKLEVMNYQALIEQYGTTIPKPKRGGRYSQGEWGEIRSIFDSLMQSPPVQEKLKEVDSWRDNMVKSLGEEYFKELFLTSSRYEDLKTVMANPFNLKACYPTKELEIYLRNHTHLQNYAVLCQYGDCIFHNPENRTYEKVMENYQNAMSESFESFDKYLKIISNIDLYDGSISLKEWAAKYAGKSIDTALKAYLLRKVYQLEINKDYDYHDALTNYFKNQPDQPTEKSKEKAIIPREVMEKVVWESTPKIYKSTIEGIQYIMIIGGLTPLTDLQPEELQKKYEQAKNWTNDFISNVNFTYQHFKDKRYYEESKSLFHKLKKLLESVHQYQPVESTFSFDIKEEIKAVLLESIDEPISQQGKLRPDFMQSPILLGKEIEIVLPNGEKRKGQFAIVELENIIASHNERTFASSNGYPTTKEGNNVNDRNYQDDPNAQAKVLEVAQNFEPALLISTSRTPAGTPIISTDGFVISGNNRTMSLKIILKDYPEKYNEYKELLLEESQAFGISESDMLNIKLGQTVFDKRKEYKPYPLQTESDFIRIHNPILLRIDYDFPEYTTIELSKYNKDTKKSERPIDKAIKLSSILNHNERLKDAISHLVGEYETLSGFYSSTRDQQKLIHLLVESNILTEQERASFYSESGFNEAGKDLIESILASIVLKKEALVASEMIGVKRIRGILITSLPVLVKNASLSEGDLLKEINGAVILEKKINASGLSFADFISQSNLFEALPERNTFIINRLLSTGRNNFKKALEAYNASVMENQGENLFGNKPSLEEIFKAHIASMIDDKELHLIDTYVSSVEVSSLNLQDQLPFFEDSSSELFFQEVRKFKTLNEFKKKYRELNKWIDLKDKATLGIIRITDTNWYPTTEYIKYSEEPQSYPFFQKLLNHVKSGKGIPPVIAEPWQLVNGQPGYMVRDGKYRLSAYEHAGIEYIPALVYETKIDSLTRDFDNPDKLTIEEFLNINLKELYDKATQPGNFLENKVKAGNYHGRDKKVENVLISVLAREPFASHFFSDSEIKEAFENENYQDLSQLKEKNLSNVSPPQMYELIQLGHPDDYGIEISRVELLGEWEKRGKVFLEELGFPTELDYPYVNKYTGYKSVESLAEILEIGNVQRPLWWWTVAEHNLPIANMDKALEIIEKEIERLKEEKKTLLNPETGKPKAKNVSQVNSITFDLKEYQKGKEIIENYLRSQNKNSNKSHREKEVEAQHQRLRLLKKKKELQKQKAGIQ